MSKKKANGSRAYNLGYASGSINMEVGDITKIENFKDWYAGYIDGQSDYWDQKEKEKKK